MSERVTIWFLICGTVVVLATLALVGYLVRSGYGSEALLGLGSAAIVGYLRAIHVSTNDLKGRVQAMAPPASSAPVSPAPTTYTP